MEHNCNQDNKYEFSFSHMYTKYKQFKKKQKNNLNSEINLAAHKSCNLGSFSPAWFPPMSCSKLFFHPWLALHLFFHLHYSSTDDNWQALHYSSTHDWQAVHYTLFTSAVLPTTSDMHLLIIQFQEFRE